LAWKSLIKNPIKIATVINFPHAKDSIEKITHDIQQAILDGANEIDAVMPHDDNGEFVQLCKKLCGDKAQLKIILESGELDDQAIEKKSNLAIQYGADFLKTSTGKVSVGATPRAATLMLNSIKNSGKTIGFKASGGVRTLEDAAIYVNLAKEILGSAAFSPNRFRIGTTKLLEDILCAFPNPN
jgi:deoxyribose-phosphate aldolase